MLDGIKIGTQLDAFPNNVILDITDGDFAGCSFFYEGMRMADHENEDGSMNMSFDYTITNGFKPEDKDTFDRFLGDNLMSILEEQIKKQEVVFKGGTD